MKRKFSMKWAASAAFFLCALFALLPTTARAEEVQAAIDDLPTTIIGGKKYYAIRNADDLYVFAEYVNSNQQIAGVETLDDTTDDVYSNSADAVLIADIVINPGSFFENGTYNPQNGEEVRVWTPIGLNCDDESVCYQGTFDGGGHSVSGVYYSNGEADSAGFFGEIGADSTVKNLSVKNSYIKGKRSIGGVLGDCYGRIVNCSFSGFVSAPRSVGGVVGYINDNASAENCRNEGDVTGTAGAIEGFVGGVVGGSQGAVTNCCNTGTIKGDDYIGGVVGVLSGSGSAENCYNAGTVTGSSNVGGVAGRQTAGTITNCYNTGDVSGSSYVGGVVGNNFGTVTNCYYQNNTETEDGGKTAGQFASGEVAYLLNGSTSEGDLVWGQTIGTDAAPVLGGAKVYQNQTGGCTAESYTYGYSNEEKDPITSHTGGTATCEKKAICDNCLEEYGEFRAHSPNPGTGSCQCGYNPIQSVTVSGDTEWDYDPEKSVDLTVTYELMDGYSAESVSYSYSFGEEGESFPKNSFSVGTGWFARENPYEVICYVYVDDYWKSTTFTATVNKATLAYTAPVAIRDLVYNGTEQELVSANTDTGVKMQFALGTDATTVPIDGWSEDIPTGTNAGDYYVWYKVAHANDYYAGNYKEVEPACISASIEKADLNVTADNKFVVVGGAIPELTYTITGFVGGDTTEVVTGSPTLACDCEDTSETGEHFILVDVTGMSAGDNYSFNDISGTLYVLEHIHNFTGASLGTTNTENDTIIVACDAADCPDSGEVKIILVAPENSVYSPGEWHNAEFYGDVQIDLDGEDIVYSADPVNAGAYTASITYGGKTASVTYEVAKAPLTIKADSKSAYVNGSEPTYTYTAIDLYEGHTIRGVVVGCASADLTKAGTYEITVSLEGLTVLDGETDVTANYAITTANGTLTVSVPYTPPSSYDDYYYPSTPSTPSTENVTIPGTDSSVKVEASIQGDKATVDEIDLSKPDTPAGDDADTGTVTIDFSGIDSKEPVTTVEIPVDVVRQIAEAVSDPSNDTENLEVILSNGTSIEFDAAALGEKAAQAGGLDITISIEHHDDAELTHAQQNAVGDRPAYDINVTSGGKHISDMGGKITVSAPYELRNGEKPGGLIVYYVDDHGNRERCETRYDEKTKRVSWKTDHLSLYMIDYDETLAEVCDGGQNCPIRAFSDADPAAWYHDGVHYCVQNGLMNGLPGGLFGPDSTTTRAQIVTILWRLEGQPVVNYLMQFEDVVSENWYTEAIRWAAAEKIVEGYNGLFCPDDAITREQMAAILWRYAQYKGYDVSVGEDTNILSYPDAFDISEYAIPAMQWACGSGLIGGIADGDDMKLAPSDSATRAQVATILWRFCENVT